MVSKTKTVWLLLDALKLCKLQTHYRIHSLKRVLSLGNAIDALSKSEDQLSHTKHELTRVSKSCVSDGQQPPWWSWKWYVRPQQTDGGTIRSSGRICRLLSCYHMEEL